MTSEPTEGAGRDRFSAALSGVTAALLVVAAALVVTGAALPSEDVAADEAARVVALEAADPTRLRVPSLDVDARLVPIVVDEDRVLAPPEDPAVVGWWEASARPGERKGQTVLTGHTLHAGDGALDRLPRLRRGAHVDLVTGKGTMRYRVTGVEVLDIATVAERAQELFGQDRQRGRLVLVSCTDWNGSSYDSNVIAFARPLGQPNTGS